MNETNEPEEKYATVCGGNTIYLGKVTPESCPHCLSFPPQMLHQYFELIPTAPPEIKKEGD